MKNKWIKKDGTALVSTTDKVDDTTQRILQQAQETKTMPDAKMLADFKKRKLVATVKVITYTIEKGPKYSKHIPIESTELTADMIMDGSWKHATFKPYNFNARGAAQGEGALHPLNKVRTELRNIFFDAGFTEMPTSRYVYEL